MNHQEDIKREFGKFAAQFGPKVISVATVTAIDADELTVNVLFADDREMEGVRLKALVKDGNHFVMLPAIGSGVMVGKVRNEDEYVVLVADEITEIKGVIESSQLSVNADGFLFKKDTDTLRDALIKLIEAIEPIVIMEGRNPDLIKLAAAKVQIQNLLRDA